MQSALGDKYNWISRRGLLTVLLENLKKNMNTMGRKAKCTSKTNRASRDEKSSNI